MAEVDIDKLEKALRGLVQTIYEECTMSEVYYEGEFEQDIQNVVDAFKTKNFECEDFEPQIIIKEYGVGPITKQNLSTFLCDMCKSQPTCVLVLSGRDKLAKFQAETREYQRRIAQISRDTERLLNE